MIIERAPVTHVYLILPPPISANAIWRSINRGGRSTAIKSKRYRDWLSVAGQMIHDQNPGRIEGAYGLKIRAPKKCRIDLDNIPKAINDLCQAHGIVSNDRHCTKILVERGWDADTHVWLISSRDDD